MKQTLKIGVRTIVEHVFRCGDLRFEFFSQRRALDGIKAHQYLQERRSADYKAEVSLKYCHQTSDYLLEISGRIDGIFSEGKTVVLEEIKSTTKDVAQLGEDKNPVHWAQLKAYAFMYASQCRLTEIAGQLTYIHMEKFNICETRETFELDELRIFFVEMIQQYLKWADHLLSWETIRSQSIQTQLFPFDQYRTGQRQMAIAVYRTVFNRQRIMIQAPTGIGKTIAAIFPAIKAMEKNSLGKLFYLTARTTGRITARKVFDILAQKGLRFKTITLTAKDKICFSSQKKCDPDECLYAKGYYDRINDALWQGLKHDRLSRSQIETIARQFSVCPFEFSLDMSQWSDGIICDYNYVFDPNVFLRRYFSDAMPLHNLLVDEAHNLVDRSREMFSAQIDGQSFLELKKILKGKLKALTKSLVRLDNWFLAIGENAPKDEKEWSHQILPADLLPLLSQFVEHAENRLRLAHNDSYSETLLEQYFNVLRFLKAAEEFGDNYAVCYSKKEGNVSVKLFCMDPSHQLKSVVKRCAAAVFFSATLAPMDYFQSLFGLNDKTKRLALPSPFPRQNLALLQTKHISTYYRHRKFTCQPLNRLLLKFTSIKRGNYLFFFPSYAYLTMIHTLFTSAAPDADIIIQTPDMSETDRKLFLEQFKSENQRTLVGFAVLGGVFGEGIDLSGDRLCGAAVIGVGLPGICLERELIRGYYQARASCGFEFAYQYPGMNRVLQAVGRVIRSEKDRGVVLLIDSRFSTKRYLDLFPDYWEPVCAGDSDRLRSFLMGFWQGGKGKVPGVFPNPGRKKIS